MQVSGCLAAELASALVYKYRNLGGAGMRWKIWFVVVMLLAFTAVLLLEGDFPVAEVDAKYSNEQSQFFNLEDGTTIHYRDQGLAQGLPIVLVHGSNASLHTWDAWVTLLKDRYRLISLDLPGHGLTGRTIAHDYSSAAYVATVQALLTHLGLTKVVIGGNSMGGGVSWRFALADPSAVIALILVDASGLPQWRQTQEVEIESERNNPATPWAFSLLRQAWFQSIARYIDPYWLVVQGLEASHFDPALVDDQLIDRYYDLSMRAGTRDATLKRFATRNQSSVSDLELAAIVQPTLILWGAQDAVIPSSVGRQFESVLPNAQLIVYPNTGHIPMEEIPERSAADVDKFLQGQVVLPAP